MLWTGKPEFGRFSGSSRLDVSRPDDLSPLFGFAGEELSELGRRERKNCAAQIGEALTFSANQWPTLIRYLDDGRLKIDNSLAEQAIRPLAVGRRNWLHIGGDGGLRSAAVLLSIAASAKRHHVNPWDYVKHILTELPARAAGSNLTDLLPDVWAKANAAAQ